MSYDTNRNWFYKILGGNTIRLLRLRRTSSSIPDNQGRVVADDNELIYPDETITNGLRVEYSAIVKPFVTADPGTLSSDSSETSWSNPSLTEDSSPDEESYINLNKALCLAVVDYVMAKKFEREGDIERKEYYTKEFWKKVADEESNKRTASMVFTDSVYAVR